MKKTLRIMFILLVLAGGFLYIVKNPDLPISEKILTTLWIDMTNDEWTWVDLTNCLSYFDGCNTCMVSGGVIGGCTKMFCQEPAEPQCLEYVWTGMDLSGCVSYFDGCNNCSVENGRPRACTEMYCETPSEPKCNEYATGSELTGIFVNDAIFIKETIDRTKKIGDEEPNQDFVLADYIINQSGFSVYVLDTSKISWYDILIATWLSELTILERYPSTLLNNVLTDWRMIDFGHENWVHELPWVQVPNTDFSRAFVAFEGQSEANLVFYIVFRKWTYLVKIDFHPSYLEKSGPLSPTLEKTIQKFYDGQETMRNSEVRDNSDMASEEFKTYRINEFKTYYNNNLAKDTEYNNFLDTVINNAISIFAIK